MERSDSTSRMSLEISFAPAASWQKTTRRVAFRRDFVCTSRNTSVLLHGSCLIIMERRSGRRFVRVVICYEPTSSLGAAVDFSFVAIVVSEGSWKLFLNLEIVLALFCRPARPCSWWNEALELVTCSFAGVCSAVVIAHAIASDDGSIPILILASGKL